jgi:hypothetical protein
VAQFPLQFLDLFLVCLTFLAQLFFSLGNALKALQGLFFLAPDLLRVKTFFPTILTEFFFRQRGCLNHSGKLGFC